MQHAKRELNKKKIQNRQQKWIKLIQSKNKQTKEDLNTMTVHLVWGGEQNWVTVCTHLKK